MAIQIATNQMKDDAVTAAKVELDSGNYHFASGASLRWAGTVSDDTDLTTKAYVDSIAQGLHWKDSVVAATTENGTMASSFANGQSIDGVSLTTGDRILIKDQSDGEDNGIYIVAASGAPARASDMNAGAEFPGAAVFVKQGTVNADAGFVCTNDAAPTVGTTAIVFVQFTGAGQIVAGNGLAKSGNTLSVVVDDSSIEISSDTLQVKAGGITNAMLEGSIANAKLANSSVSFGGVSVALGASDATPAFDLTDATNYPTSSLTGTITNAQLAGSITDSKLSQITTSDKVAGSAVELAAASAIEDSSGLRLKSSAAGDGLDLSNAQVLNVTGVTNAMISNSAAIAYSKLDLSGAVLNADLAGSIANAKLANSSITAQTLGGGETTSVSLGGTLTFDDIAFTISSDTVMLKANGVDFSALKMVPARDEFSANGSTAAFNLNNRIQTAAWLNAAIVFRNGLLCKKVNSSPSDTSEYTIVDSGGSTTITFGANLDANETVSVQYFYE